MMRTVRFNMLKLSWLAISLSALFASCKEDVEEDVVAEKRNANSGVISFSAYTAGATRAKDVTIADFLSKQETGIAFKVAAWKANSSNYFFKDDTRNNMGTADGKCEKEDGIFDTKNETYYWPQLSDDYPISFYAFNDVTKAGWNKSDSPKEVSYQIQNTAGNNYDLVVAYARADEMPVNGVLPLNFIHALSKVNFSFVGADKDQYIYTVNKVEIISAGNKGVVSFKKSTEVGSTSNPSEMIAWNYTKINDISSANPLVKSSGAGQGFLCTYYNNNTGFVTGGKTAKAVRNESCRLIPQKGKIAIRVYYKVEYKDSKKLKGNCGFYETDEYGNHNVMLDSDGKVVNSGGTNKYTSGGIKGCKTLVVDLGKDVPEWEPSKAYRFTLTLPTANFRGDFSGDGVADDRDAFGNDLDGDGDDDVSEFKSANPILFSVRVDPWEAKEYNGNITIN